MSNRQKMISITELTWCWVYMFGLTLVGLRDLQATMLYEPSPPWNFMEISTELYDKKTEFTIYFSKKIIYYLYCI